MNIRLMLNLRPKLTLYSRPKLIPYLRLSESLTGILVKAKLECQNKVQVVVHVKV